MSASDSAVVAYDAPLEAYERQAQGLFSAVSAGEREAAWRFKWEHPRFRGKDVADVRAASLTIGDARTVVAREYAFDAWPELEAYVETVGRDERVRRFEAAVDAVVSGDTGVLRSLLAEDPSLARERSSRRHHATLLHYVAANGVEGGRQKTPPNAVQIATMLLDAGSDPNALADMYGAKCTTMSMLVSSGHPAAAGLQGALAETLVDHGAQLDGQGSAWQSAVMTALQFGYLDTARALVRRGGSTGHLAIAAGLGRLDDVVRLLPGAADNDRHAALALAAQHGHADVVALLLDRGESPDRLNPEGFHAHSTPLHQAVWADHMDVVRLLVERGARLDIRDTVYHATALGWAEYGERVAITEYLRSRGAPA
jgi:ankyrin repeat protein